MTLPFDPEDALRLINPLVEAMDAADQRAVVLRLPRCDLEVVVIIGVDEVAAAVADAGRGLVHAFTAGKAVAREPKAHDRN